MIEYDGNHYLNIKNQKMSKLEHQICLYDILKRGYKLCQEKPTMVPKQSAFAISYEEMEDYLIQNTKIESYKMLVVNYTIALIGYKKNDKLSLQNYPPQGKDFVIKEFCNQNKPIIEKIYAVRDKVYSHFDIDYETQTENIEFSEIGKIIDFIGSVLGC